LLFSLSFEKLPVNLQFTIHHSFDALFRRAAVQSVHPPIYRRFKRGDVGNANFRFVASFTRLNCFLLTL